MKSLTSCWNICFLIFAACMPQGYTFRRHRVDIEGIVESGSNITEILKNIIVYPGSKIIIENQPKISGQSEEWEKKIKDQSEDWAKKIKDQSEDWKKQIKVQSEEWEKKFKVQSEDWAKKLKEAIAKQIVGMFVSSKENEKSTVRSGLWSAAEAFITYLAIALSGNRDGQAIAQPGIETKQYSLLQDIKSGRIRGPVHVYGRHAAKSIESSDDD